MLLTQCKKSEEAMPSAGEPVNITLNVGGNSKIGVNTGAGIVTFVNDDKIYVASGGEYVGTLNYQGNEFTGSVKGAKENEPLWFYFLGNKMPSETLTEGVTDTFTVDISDQRNELPVISFAKSNENYTSENHSYTSQLKNQCALVEFTGINGDGGDATVNGLFNQVTVELNNNNPFGFGYKKVDNVENKDIILNKTEIQTTGTLGFWAILLPQNNITCGSVSYDGKSGTYQPYGSEIKCNDFLHGSSAFTVTFHNP